MGCVPQKPPPRKLPEVITPPKAGTAARGPSDVFRMMGMTGAEFAAALVGVKCDYCGTVVRGERCSNCGAPRKDLS